MYFAPQCVIVRRHPREFYLPGQKIGADYLQFMKLSKLQSSEQTASKLQEASERGSVSPEQLSILSIEENLAQLEDEFRRSAEYVLQKNAELYSRLS